MKGSVRTSNRDTQALAVRYLRPVNVSRTATGLRLSQHGVVISELRTTAGPTHSVFDVLATLVSALTPRSTGDVGLLGFAGGGMMAPLAALGYSELIHTVDLDAKAFRLFRRYCPHWLDRVEWQQSDAAVWLRARHGPFKLLVEDLSIPLEGDVIKPEICWSALPQLIRQRLRLNGIAIFNLLPPDRSRATREIEAISQRFRSARVVDFVEYQNRILVTGRNLPSARALSNSLRRILREMRSKQADRIRVTGLKN